MKNIVITLIFIASVGCAILSSDIRNYKVGDCFLNEGELYKVTDVNGYSFTAIKLNTQINVFEPYPEFYYYRFYYYPYYSFGSPIDCN